MIAYMKPSNTLWATLALCAAGLWAGVAGAQTGDEPGGWFEDSAPAQLPAEPPADSLAQPQAEPPAESPPEVTVPDYSAPPSDYSAPPSDFQAPPPEAAVPEAAPPAPVDPAAEAEGQQRAVEEFGPELAPYGSWVDDPRYGRIWVPARSVVGTEFVPYASAGHWQLTPDNAWLWASDYPFGGITFHYGRWVWASGGVWGWVPGYVYAPAWVDFRIGAAGYIGWAPLAPRYVWRSGYFVSVGLWSAPPPIYCPTQYVFARSMPRYIVHDHHRVRSLSAQTYPYRPRHGYAYVGRGPTPREAHIPRNALPTRRVLAQPRYTGSGRVSAQPRYTGSGRVLAQPHSAQSQYSRERGAEPRPQIRVYGNGASGRGSRGGAGQNGSGWNSPDRNYSNTYGTPRVRNYDGPSRAGRQDASPGVRGSNGPSNARRPNPATRPMDAGQQWRSRGGAAGSGQGRSRQAPGEARAAWPAQPEPASGNARHTRRTAMPERASAPVRGVTARQPQAESAYGQQQHTYGTAPARSYARSDGGSQRSYGGESAARGYARSGGGQPRATRRASSGGDAPSHGRSYARSSSRSYR